MTSIPASQLVNITPSVLVPGGNPLSLNCVMLTRSIRVPMFTVQAFSSLEDVQNFFGPTSIEAELAGKYFGGFAGALTLPGTLYFMQHPAAAVAGYLRSGSFEGVSLAALQTLSGQLIIPVDGRPVTSANIDLSTATSFTNAAALIQTGLQTANGLFSGTGRIDDGNPGNPGNILTITAVASGSVALGDTVTGAGIAPGTVITALQTGTGGIGTYTVGGAPQDVAVGAVSVASAVTAAYDAQLAAFVITSPITGLQSSVGFATGTLAAGARLQAAQGAVLSPGADLLGPEEIIALLVEQTQNWATFMTTYEPVLADKLEFAQSVQELNERYAYICWDSDPAALGGGADESFAAQCKAANMDGIWPQWEPATDAGNGRKAAFIAGAVASIDWDQPNSRITFAYKGQAGLVADITNATQADALISNGYNFYGAYATANDRFVMTQPGQTPGAWKWFDAYINQIWLNSELQLAFMSLLTQSPSIPYNAEGYNLLRQAANDPIQRALINGVIQVGVTLSNSQKAQVNTAAGVNIADSLQNNGYYLQILDAPPEVRVVRGSPPMRLWYTDGGSIHNIDLASINVQ